MGRPALVRHTSLARTKIRFCMCRSRTHTFHMIISLSSMYSSSIMVFCHRVQKHLSAIKLLDAQLDSSAGAAGTSKLEREWQEDTEALSVRLQKHREGAVARCRYSTTAVSYLFPVMFRRLLALPLPLQNFKRSTSHLGERYFCRKRWCTTHLGSRG